MKKITIFFLILMAVCAVIQAPAFAQQAKGKITAVDTASRTLEVTQVDPAAKSEEKVKITTRKTTAVVGSVHTVEDLKVGTEVLVTGDHDEKSDSLLAVAIQTLDEKEKASDKKDAPKESKKD